MIEYPRRKIIETVHQTKSKLEKDLGREPMDVEIAFEMGETDPEEIGRALSFEIEKNDEEENEVELGSLRFRLTTKNYEMEKRRLELGLKQSDVAGRMGVKSYIVNHIECCRRFPTIEEQEKLSKILKTSADKLFPDWLRAFSKQWLGMEHSRIVPINQVSLTAPEIMFLESPDGPEEIEQYAERELLIDKIGKALELLPSKEQEIIKYRYGFGKNRTNTFEETAQKFGVTRERIRQIEAKGLERLRQSENIKKLVD